MWLNFQRGVVPSYTFDVGYRVYSHVDHDNSLRIRRTKDTSQSMQNLLKFFDETSLQDLDLPSVSVIDSASSPLRFLKSRVVMNLLYIRLF
ncbi:hypothetical protein Tco_0543934 [Tanacetum coccineum]